MGLQDKVVQETEGWNIQQLEELRVVLIRQANRLPLQMSSRVLVLHSTPTLILTARLHTKCILGQSQACFLMRSSDFDGKGIDPRHCSAAGAARLRSTVQTGRQPLQPQLMQYRAS